MATTIPITGTKGGRVDFLVRQGADFIRVLTIRDRVALTPIDLTGQTLAGQVRKTADAASSVATISLTVTDAVNGQVRLKIANTATAAMTCDPDDENADASKYVYDVERTDGAGEKHPVIYGDLYLWREVTK